LLLGRMRDRVATAHEGWWLVWWSGRAAPPPAATADFTGPSNRSALLWRRDSRGAVVRSLTQLVDQTQRPRLGPAPLLATLLFILPRRGGAGQAQGALLHAQQRLLAGTLPLE